MRSHRGMPILDAPAVPGSRRFSGDTRPGGEGFAGNGDGNFARTSRPPGGEPLSLHVIAETPAELRLHRLPVPTIPQDVQPILEHSIPPVVDRMKMESFQFEPEIHVFEQRQHFHGEQSFPQEIVGMRAGDPTPEELKRVQEGALLALPAEFATPSDTLFTFQRLEFYNLPLDWYAGYQGRLKAVDTAAVHKAAEKHLRAKDFVVLVVGDAAKVLPDLDAIAKEQLFGKGGVVVLDADGKPTARP